MKIPLNIQRKSDYYFGTADFRTFQFSRKQSHELLSNVDEAEAQIRDYYDSADENFQIVEGLISPFPLSFSRRKPDPLSVWSKTLPNTLYSYKVSDSGWIYDEHAHNVSSSMYYSWLLSLEQCGVVTFFTINLIDTARLLTAFYKNKQRPRESHTTLQRFIKPRINIKELNSLAGALMSLSSVYGLGIGEDKANKLAERYSNLASIAMATERELCEISGIGKVLARRLITSLGGSVE